MSGKVYERLAGLTEARTNCIKAGNTEWQRKHEESVGYIIKNYLPHGGGFDMGTGIDFIRSSSKRLVFTSSFHVMDDNGCYDGWIDFRVIVTPDLCSGFDVRIVGPFGRRQDLREYIADVFMEDLNGETEA